MAGLRLALSLFTVVPMGRLPEPLPPARRAILWAPVVGVVLGLAAAAVLYFGRVVFGYPAGEDEDLRLLPSVLAAAVAVVTLHLLSGGLHLDGLADTADGVAARADADRTATVMADPATGAMGAFAVAASLLLDTAALAVAVTRGHGTEALVVAALAGRVAIVWGCTQPAARAEGMGAWVARCVGPAAAIVVTGLALLVPLALSGHDVDTSRRSLVFALAALPAGLAAAALATAGIRRRLGGITGDVLGASCSLATTGALLLMACAP